MRGSRVVALAAAVLAAAAGPAWANGSQFPKDATVTTLVTTERVIEGLTGDAAGNLYTVERNQAGLDVEDCVIWRVTGASLTRVGHIPAGDPPCSPSGLAFNEAGELFVADGDKIWTLTPSAPAPPEATEFAVGVPGANGVAFDRNGNLWTGDGTTGHGRVWRIAPCATPPCAPVEVFRVQPMRNGTSLGATLAGDGVGRQARTFPPGTSTITVPAGTPLPTTVTPAGGQDLVANGLAFTRDGDLLVADTARGAIWKVKLDRQGNVESRTNGDDPSCDGTFTDNTLCLDSILVAHPLLEGADGIALDRAGNIWTSVNERNSLAVVTKDGQVLEVFRNPANAAGRRNSADAVVGNDHILEFPASPFILGDRLCTSNSDGNRRDNSPNSVGEIKPAGPARGKIACLDQDLKIPGLPLPIR